MENLNGFFLSNVLYKKVYDEEGDVVGKLFDMYVTTEEGYPRVIGYKIKKDGEMQSYEFTSINFIKEGKKITIKVKDVKDIIPRTFSYLLSKNLLDKQIVDINGKKVVRVNDLKMVKIAGEWKVMAVDCGIVPLARRFGIESLVKKIFKLLNKKVEDSLIMWDDVESLEMSDNNLKLSVSYNKLSKLHPADLADILEDMETKYRKQVFESLDYNLAANTLEEIEPKIQVDILENLSQAKVAEVLENVPNDEIADILDEVDEETAENLLLNMEKEDANEVRELMEYKEEIVGSIMNKDFISFNVNITIEETIELFREIKPDDEVAYNIYIVDENEKLKGVVTLRDLVIALPTSKLQDIMDTSIIKVRDSEKIEDTIEIAAKYNLLSIPVIDEEQKLCGIVIISDILDEVLIPTWRKRFKKVS